MTRLVHPRATQLPKPLLCVMLLLFSPVVLAPQTDAGWTWLTENFHKALDDTLPIQRDCSNCVSYRSYESLQVGDVEYSLLITPTGKGYIAHIRMPDKLPLGRQLLAMHQKQKEKTLTSMESELKFKDWNLAEARCPAVKSQYEKLQSLRVSLPSNTIMMDPTVHEFHVDDYSGTWDLVILEEQHPLVRWAVETQHLLEACTASPEPHQP
jgi:hypothetical protein